MCGILGITYIQASQEQRERAMNALSHRGPDASGQWVSPGRQVWLGHRRLSIVDLTQAGNQPMENEDGSIHLVCNGEIYNYPTLRARLENLGHTFRSQSDNEAILHAYEAWGDRFVEELEGMFAFALWDERNKRFFLARDRLGIKPLYYASVNGELLLASELRALLPLLPWIPEPDPIALAYVMTLGYIPSPSSIWRGVSKLEPAHALTWIPGKGVFKWRYWEPPRQIDSGGKRGTEEWKEIFEAVLKEHLLSDVPIGLLLSGGLDSTSLAVGLKELGHPTKAITVSFPGTKFDEAPVAKEVTNHLGIQWRQVPLRVQDVDELLGQTVAIFDEPQGYSALLSMNMVCREASRDFKVVLAGDGGDEVFGGYTWYGNLDWPGERRASRIRPLIAPLIQRGLSGRLTRLAMQIFESQSPLHRHAMRLFPRFLPEEVTGLLEPLKFSFSDEEMLEPLKRHFEPKLPRKRAFQRIDLMTFCSDSILAKVDRASMATSLEVRVPFLDRRIIEWGLTRPLSSYRDNESKPALRDYLRNRVPQSVFDHPKQGFSLRVLDDFDWVFAIERIRQGTWVQGGYWGSAWERLIKPDMPYRNARIWVLLILTLWADNWMKQGTRI